MATRRPKVYHTVEQLGAGSFGEVFLVTKTPPSRNWEMAAMKVIQSPGGNAFQEVDFLKRQQHPNIIKYYNSFKNKFGALCIVMEYCDRGTLTDFLSQVSFFDRELALSVLYVCFRLLLVLLLLLSFLNFQSHIGNIFLFLIGIFSFF